MRLGATITSERGKAITKTGNEYININVVNDKGHLLAYIQVLEEENTIRVVVPSGIALKQEEVTLKLRNNENLKHDKCNHD